jgi:hypothetical protein
MRQFQVETLIRLLASITIASCWWFAAIRLQKHWILYALAIITTVGPLLSGSMIAMTQMSGSSSGSFTFFSAIQTLLALTTAVLYIVFAGWLVSFARSTPPPPLV